MGYGQANQVDRELMALALGQARVGLEAGGVPVGAVLAAHGQLVAAGHNERVQRGDPVAHGEIACLRNAGRRPSYADTTLYTTLSPCQMCSGASGTGRSCCSRSRGWSSVKRRPSKAILAS
jgi:tRNA(Arg) A34 adenosine deaminase TadA